MGKFLVGAIIGISVGVAIPIGLVIVAVILGKSSVQQIYSLQDFNYFCLTEPLLKF